MNSFTNLIYIQLNHFRQTNSPSTSFIIRNECNHHKCITKKFSGPPTKPNQSVLSRNPIQCPLTEPTPKILALLNVELDPIFMSRGGNRSYSSMGML